MTIINPNVSTASLSNNSNMLSATNIPVKINDQIVGETDKVSREMFTSFQKLIGIESKQISIRVLVIAVTIAAIVAFTVLGFSMIGAAVAIPVIATSVWSCSMTPLAGSLLSGGMALLLAGNLVGVPIIATATYLFEKHVLGDPTDVRKKAIKKLLQKRDFDTLSNVLYLLRPEDKKKVFKTIAQENKKIKNVMAKIDVSSDSGKQKLIEDLNVLNQFLSLIEKNADEETMPQNLKAETEALRNEVANKNQS